MANGDLQDILNDGHPCENLHIVVMRVDDVPELPVEPIGVYFLGLYPAPKYIPRKLIPEVFHSYIKQGAIFTVTGNLATEYMKDLCFDQVKLVVPRNSATEHMEGLGPDQFRLAPEFDPNLALLKRSCTLLH